MDAAALPTDFTNLFLGSDLNGGNSLQGILDDFAFYSVALSGDDIGDLADGASPDEIGGGGGGAVGPYQLFSYWDFNTPSDTATLDVVNAIEGTLMGAVISDDAEGQSGAAGDRALRMGDLGTETVKVENVELFNVVAGQDVLTVSFWQKLDTVLNQTTFKGQSPSSTGAERGISVHTPWSDGTIYYDTAGCCTGGTQRLNGAPGIDFLQWHHFAFVKNGGTKQIWIDGEMFLEGVSPAADPLPEDFTALWIGAAIDGMESMHGLLDDFAMFATALDEGAMQQLAAGVRPDEIMPPVEATDVTQPGDPIELVNGENDGDADAGPPPGAEGVENAINNITQKYLHFLDLGSGFTVTPSMGGSVITGARFYPANDAVERDPASYEIWGSKVGPGGPFTLISSGPLSLPDTRNPGGAQAIDPSLAHEEVSFENTEAYLSYQVIFPTLKDAATANSMQIAEIELLGVPGEVVVPDGDSDGDGVSDTSEALAGTDPNDANDYLRVVAASNDGTEVSLEWASVEGKLYDIEYSTDQESWTVITAQPIAGAAGGVTSFQDTDPARLAEPEGYYRAVVRE
jgi:hypothetical protein